jgi:hypothetical protein
MGLSSLSMPLRPVGGGKKGQILHLAISGTTNFLNIVTPVRIGVRTACGSALVRSEPDRVPGQPAVPGQQQLSDNVAVVRVSVDDHAIAKGGESQVVPALAACR